MGLPSARAGPMKASTTSVCPSFQFLSRRVLSCVCGPLRACDCTLVEERVVAVAVVRLNVVVLVDEEETQHLVVVARLHCRLLPGRALQKVTTQFNRLN